MSAPIVINYIDGHAVCGGPADIIRAAINGAVPLTITGKKATGDIVYLAPRTKITYADGMTAETTDIANIINHPTAGEIAYAWIDTNRLAQSPQLAELERELHARNWNAARDAENRARTMVPSCDNCGDCPKCC